MTTQTESQAHSYSASGSYTPVITLYDSEGVQLATANLTNGPIEISLTGTFVVDDNKGAYPYACVFSWEFPEGCTYEIDYDEGDGYTSVVGSGTSHTYDEFGTYNPKLRVNGSDVFNLDNGPILVGVYCNGITKNLSVSNKSYMIAGSTYWEDYHEGWTPATEENLLLDDVYAAINNKSSAPVPIKIILNSFSETANSNYPDNFDTERRLIGSCRISFETYGYKAFYCYIQQSKSYTVDSNWDGTANITEQKSKLTGCAFGLDGESTSLAMNNYLLNSESQSYSLYESCHIKTQSISASGSSLNCSVKIDPKNDKIIEDGPNGEATYNNIDLSKMGEINSFIVSSGAGEAGTDTGHTESSASMGFDIIIPTFTYYPDKTYEYDEDF